MKPWTVLVPALALLGGCAGLERMLPGTMEPPPAVVETAPATAAGELLAYLGRLRALNDAALATETSRQRQAAAARPTPLERLKSALALTVSGHGDESDVLAVVDPIAKDPRADPDLRAMASFLHAIALDRRRLRESATAANTRLRDERRARENERQRAEALQERAAQLQEKLDALTELEKSLSGRRNPSR